jgi:Ala-tRNA(Pro) deacylase
MAIAQTVQQYLEEHGVPFEVVQHPHTRSSMFTAAEAHVPGDRLAKSVILEDDLGYVMVVVPSTHHVDLSAIHRQLGRPLGLATESELGGLFRDCETGAVPALGPAYGLETIVDESLEAVPDLYFEAGDHEELIHIHGEEQEALWGGAPRGSFSRHV